MTESQQELWVSSQDLEDPGGGARSDRRIQLGLALPRSRALGAALRLAGATASQSHTGAEAKVGAAWRARPWAGPEGEPEATM